VNRLGAFVHKSVDGPVNVLHARFIAAENLGFTAGNGDSLMTP
jgi:hypothetical protein